MHSREDSRENSSEIDIHIIEEYFSESPPINRIDEFDWFSARWYGFTSDLTRARPPRILVTWVNVAFPSVIFISNVRSSVSASLSPNIAIRAYKFSERLISAIERTGRIGEIRLMCETWHEGAAVPKPRKMCRDPS